MFNIPEGNNVTLTGKILPEQAEWKSLINIWNGKEALKQVYLKKTHGQRPRITFERTRRNVRG